MFITHGDVGTGTIVGSAVFNILIILALVSICSGEVMINCSYLFNFISETLEHSDTLFFMNPSGYKEFYLLPYCIFFESSWVFSTILYPLCLYSNLAILCNMLTTIYIHWWIILKLYTIYYWCFEKINLGFTVLFNTNLLRSIQFIQ